MRILDKTKVSINGSKFSVENIDNKNMYINAGMSIHARAIENEKVTPLTAYLDITIDTGCCTFSIVYINKNGKYISHNKKISTSGRYALNTIAYDINFEKKDAISLRIYPCLDNQKKNFIINKISFCFGTCPTEYFL